MVSLLTCCTAAHAQNCTYISFPQTPESADMSGVNTQIRQLQEENKQLKQRVAYVSLEHYVQCFGFFLFLPLNSNQLNGVLIIRV